jgi:hypothetical protein
MTIQNTGTTNEDDFEETFYKVRILFNIHSSKSVKFEGVVKGSNQTRARLRGVVTKIVIRVIITNSNQPLVLPSWPPLFKAPSP